MLNNFFGNLKEEYNKQKVKNIIKEEKYLLRNRTPLTPLKNIIIAIDKDGQLYINGNTKIKILNISDIKTTDIKNASTTKKLAAASVLGVATGGIGAIVGAMSVGNAKTNHAHTIYVQVYFEDAEIEEILQFEFSFKNMLSLVQFKEMSEYERKL